MTLPAALVDVRQRSRPHVLKWVGAIAVVILALALGAAVVHPDLVRPAVFLALVPLVIGVGVLAPSRLLYGLVVWLVALGLVRRLFDTTAGATSHAGLGDPLLLVEPVVMLVLVAVASQRGAFRDRTRLANAVLVLNVLAVVEVLNPLQGSPLVGVGGLLFLLVPMLAFWVGRSLVDDRMLRRLFVMIAALGVLAVIYGLFQQYRGLPSWDEAWVHLVGLRGAQRRRGDPCLRHLLVLRRVRHLPRHRSDHLRRRLDSTRRCPIGDRRSERSSPTASSTTRAVASWFWE